MDSGAVAPPTAVRRGSPLPQRDHHHCRVRWTLYLDDINKIWALLKAAGNDTELVRNVELSEVGVTNQLDMFEFV